MNEKSESADHISIGTVSSSGRTTSRSTMKTPVISLQVPSPFDSIILPPLVATTIQKTNSITHFDFVSLMDKPKESFNLTKALKNFEKEYQASEMEEMKECYIYNNKKGSIIDDSIDDMSPHQSRLESRQLTLISGDLSFNEQKAADSKNQDDLDSLDLSTHSEEKFLETNSYISLLSNENGDLDELTNNEETLSPFRELEQNEKSIVFKDMDDSTIGSTNHVTINTLPIEYKYNNLSNWKPVKIDPKIEALKFKLMQDIVYREGLLIQLKSLLKKVDERYWKYSVERIKSSEINKSINSKELVALRNRINVIQNEISVAIAHIRSLSCDIINEILKLRKLYTKAYATNESISVFWKDHNYLFKIKKDMKEIFLNRNSQSIRIWLGFDPNTFMVPDFKFNDSKTISEYNPQNKWQTNIFENIFVPWFKKHSEVMSKQWRGRIFVGDTLLSNESYDKSKEQWVALRDLAAKSWGIIGNEKFPKQGIEFAPDFWNDVNKNPFIVEAAVGFLETFPTFNIVPLLPKDLLQKCKQMEIIIQREVEMTSQLSSIRDECKSLKETVSLESNSISLSESLNQKKRLKSRQQGESSLLTGISVDYTPSTISYIDMNSNYSLAYSKNEVLSRQQVSEVGNRSNLFMTESIQGDDKTMSLIENDNSTYTSHFSSQLIDTSDFKIFRIENSNLKEIFQQKVERIREVVSFHDLKASLKPDHKGKRMLNRLSKQWMISVAIRIQRVVRGFLGRRKAKKEYDRKFAIQKAIRIQNFIRMKLAKKMRYMRKLRLQKESFFIRKEYIRQYKAAITLTNFVRFIINLKRKANNEPLLHINNDALKLKFNKMVQNNKKSPSKIKQPLLVTDNQDEIMSHKSNADELDDFLEDEEDGETEEAIQREKELNEKNFISSEEEVKRRKMEKLNAILFIKNLNKDKIERDSIRTCRLIPVKVIRNSTSQMKVNKMSIRSQHAFLPNLAPTVIRTASSADIYQGVKTLRKKSTTSGNVSLASLSLSKTNDEVSLSNSSSLSRKGSRKRTISTGSGFGEAMEKKLLDKELVEAEAFKSVLRSYI